jgi:hypothetical protein
MTSLLLVLLLPLLTWNHASHVLLLLVLLRTWGEWRSSVRLRLPLVVMVLVVRLVLLVLLVLLLLGHAELLLQGVPIVLLLLVLVLLRTVVVVWRHNDSAPLLEHWSTLLLVASILLLLLVASNERLVLLLLSAEMRLRSALLCASVSTTLHHRWCAPSSLMKVLVLRCEGLLRIPSLVPAVCSSVVLVMATVMEAATVPTAALLLGVSLRVSAALESKLDTESVSLWWNCVLLMKGVNGVLSHRLRLVAYPRAALWAPLVVTHNFHF